MTRPTRPISWIKAALKEFEKFPEGARSICLAALTIAAEGGKADIAKPLIGLGSGVFEICCRSGAMRFAWSMPCKLAMKSGWCMRSRRNRRKASKRRRTRSI